MARPPQAKDPSDLARSREELPLSFQTFRTSTEPTPAYGYHLASGLDSLEHMRDREFGRLRGTTYLDHAGATLFPQSQLTRFMKDLSENVYGNPHSQNLSSKLTFDTIEHVRYRILEHFNTTAEDYTVIFTSGSTAALKLVGEAFPWNPTTSEHPGSRFHYLTDSHTSVVGLRAIADPLNVVSTPVNPREILLMAKRRDSPREPSCKTPHLFCYPAQSNFSGTRYPLSWIREVKAGNLSPMTEPGEWFVLLDAASYVSTSPLDLTSHPADFVPVSFYKIFGFPTGLGALLVNSRIAPFLRKTYFGGGTASAYLAGEDFYIPRQSVAERFEDGTVSFLDIIALKHGFDTLEALTGGMEKIKQHTFTLTRYTYTVLASLRYPNGAPVVRVYSDTKFDNPDTQGPIINFNVLDENGYVIGYSQVDKMASLHNIHLRTGCFCNTGACQQHLEMSNETIKRNLQAGHVCGDNMDIVDGQPTGSVRISFGYMSTVADAQAFLKFIVVTRLLKSNAISPSPATLQELTSGSKGSLALNVRANGKESNDISREDLPSDLELGSGLAGDTRILKMESDRSSLASSEAVRQGGLLKPVTVTNIYIYPIKSCAAFEVTQWPVGDRGLLHDRTWMIVNQNGVCLSQKQEPRLCLIRPSIDLKQDIMVLKAEGMEPITVPLERESGVGNQICQRKVCGDRVNTYDCGEEIADWLTEFFGRQCRLTKQSSDFRRTANKKQVKELSSSPAASLSLVNQAQYLLINTASIWELQQQLNNRVENRSEELFEIKELISRFRANIVINGTEAFEEEMWAEVRIGTLHLQVLGPCHRCQMICIDQGNGQGNKDVFQTLSASRDRKVNFGIYLMQRSSDVSPPRLLSVGTPVLSVLKEDEKTHG
ncbi:molybdenum cofactor sulfurase [Tachyglossus aculeatus]|uniref:molybdenum cofactor sulfurase n=1 Tax=Tachyglossus aculeatus TaxID=9261 RepID=UPI0018F6377E|nr:molybdenum cofactor sulfurase [Tachyglossus aculeatus]